jgi:hypothetical protein
MGNINQNHNSNVYRFVKPENKVNKVNKVIPGINDDKFFAGKKFLESFPDVRRNHFLRLLVILVEESVGPDVLDRVLRIERPEAVESKAVDKTDAGTFQDLNQVEVGEQDSPIRPRLCVAYILLPKAIPII